MKKTLALLIALCLLLGLGATAFVGAEPETVDLKFYRPIFSMTPQGTQVEQEWQRLMEEKLGVKLNLTWEELPWGEYGTKMPVYMAAGEWADAFLCTSGASTINEYGQTGMILNVKDYLNADDSYYLQMVNANPKNVSNVTASDGGIYTFGETMVSQNDAGAQACWAARFDVFEELGLKVPETMQEIYDAAVKLKEAYPNSHPVYVGFNNLNRWLSLYKAGDTMLWTGEEYVYSPKRDEAEIEKAIGFLAKLYAEGLLDPEFSSDTSDQYNAKCLNDSIFITSFAYHTRIAG
ncbi:MAG TPA: extracellular solute-binding protein, partial [Clostridia bacterium]|nr:extracellular solute-binding protein [Clostridia bacterium]